MLFYLHNRYDFIFSLGRTVQIYIICIFVLFVWYVSGLWPFIANKLIDWLTSWIHAFCGNARRRVVNVWKSIKSLATFGSGELSIRSGEHAARHRTGHYNGLAVFVRFIESDSLTLHRNDLLELKLVRPSCVCVRFCRSALRVQYYRQCGCNGSKICRSGTLSGRGYTNMRPPKIGAPLYPVYTIQPVVKPVW